MYASPSVHRLRDQRRFDDLYSVLYTYADFVNGGLPWRKYATGKDKCKETVREIKEGSRSEPALMCELTDLGPEFYEALGRAGEVLEVEGWEAAPDYDAFKSRLREAGEGAEEHERRRGGGR